MAHVWIEAALNGSCGRGEQPSIPVTVEETARADYLDAHLRLLNACAPGATWMAAGLGVDIRPLIAPTVARGGHVRVGLEDAPWRTPLSNRRSVEEAARLVRAA